MKITSIAVFILLFPLIFAETFLCNSCHFLISSFNSIFENETCILIIILILVVINLAEKIWMSYCSFTKTACAEMWVNNGLFIVKNLPLRLNPDILCPKLGICKNSYVSHETLSEFQKKMLLDKPPRRHQTNNSPNLFKFVVVTDPHVDLNYTQVFL